MPNLTVEVAVPHIASSVRGLPRAPHRDAAPGDAAPDPRAHDGAAPGTAAVCRHLLGDALDAPVQAASAAHLADLHRAAS